MELGSPASAKEDLASDAPDNSATGLWLLCRGDGVRKLAVPSRANKAIHLNDSATLIWKLCDGSRSVQDIVDLLKMEYPGSEAAVDGDVREAIALLVSEGALLDAHDANEVKSDSAQPILERE